MLAVLLCAAAIPHLTAAAPPKQTVMVPMRDGVFLASDIYLPEGTGPFPTILIRTPYSKEGIGNIGIDGAKRGYAIVSQDTRGRFASEGPNLPFETDGWDKVADGYDAAEWVAQQAWCNGRVGTWGGSAVGITQLMLAGSGSPRITAQHITVGAPSLYRDCVYPGGVFKKSMIEDWLRISKFSPDALTHWTSHPTLDDYWTARELNRRYQRVNTAGVHIGGWFDIFAQGSIDAFVGYQERGGPRAKGRQKLLMGPWTHGVLQDKAGDLQFPKAKKPPTDFHDAWRWFDATLRGATNGVLEQPAVVYYVMGDVDDPQAPGNVWRQADHWPPVPARPTPCYCWSDRTLSTRMPDASPASLTYTYDPAQPVPTIGGPQLTLPAGPKDQRPIENRADVLVFSTDPIEKPLEVTGRVRVKLWAACDARDTDFFARLCDVYPDGRSMNICEGQLRARFQQSFSRERLLEPGKVYPFELDLGSTSIIFNRGHRVRLDVTSSSAPGFDPNPNTGEPFRSSARQQVAHNTVYLDARHPTQVVLPLVTE
jgi:predicted acyl esterase